MNWIKKIKRFWKYIVGGLIITASASMLVGTTPEPLGFQRIEVKRTLNSKHWQISPTQFQAEFHTNPIHWQDFDGSFKDINLNFVDASTTAFYRNSSHIFDISIPKVFNASQIYETKGRTGKLILRPEGANPVMAQIRATEGGKMTSDILFYPDVWLNTDAEIHSKHYGMKMNIIVKATSSPKTFSFQIQEVGLNRGLLKPKHDLDKIGKFRSILTFKNGTTSEWAIFPLKAFDRNKQEVELTYETRTVGVNTFLDISYDDTGKIYPITLDPNTGNLFPAAGANSPVDGSFNANNGDTWANLRARANSNVVSITPTSDQAAFISDNGTNFTNFIRFGYAYDTSSIGAGNQADSASTTLYGTGGVETNNHGDELSVVDWNPATTTATLITTDWVTTNTDGATGFETTKIAADVTYAAWNNAAGAANQINLTDVTPINVTGITTIGTRKDRDVDNSAPATANNESNWEIRTADFAGTSSDPTLAVTYSAAPEVATSWDGGAQIIFHQ